ncbi:glycoside hydrolase family 2 protein [Photobacterium lutimaris]|uniref:beta-mannosidase n=1 Tax=Photobacterium lutimaris TaxID=388278 RepID=A0A2T3J1K1_9GAMM|nr:glycoside hydrolase family 2 TIM barrel-domain containing protein [Photobacterium lutimaris]PSU34964.1 beta-mannosidase [Photobacterium lutimaris]TDR77318.1 beta-mannosidase [Photobacterium lutimaris]
MRIILLLALFSLSSCAFFSENNDWIVNIESLNGNWRLEIIDENDNWAGQYSVTVPGHWKMSGINYAGAANYHRQFNVERLFDSGRVWLELEGVDYESAVTVNNQYISRNVGYFIPHQIELTGHLQAGTNALNVWVNSPNEHQTADWSLHKTLIKGVLNHHDTRPGGAWSDKGQDWNSGGIWGDVTIRQTGPIALRAVKVRPQVNSIEKSLTSAGIQLDVDSAREVSATIEMVLQHQGVDSEHYVIEEQIQPGQTTVELALPQATRALWWPWDWGKPNLYDLSVSVFIDGKLTDQKTVPVGFREMGLDSENKQFLVNGQPYFVRGTNYIASQWLGEVTAEQYQQDLNLMKEANINSVRVHAHVAGKAFYDLADKAGLVIWQDFPLQWGYIDSPRFALEAARQAKAMTDLLYNHPSIAFWSGHNEPPWDATWMQYKYPSYQPNQNKFLTERVYQALTSAGDGRVVRKASYTHEHPWLGWYSGTYKDYRTYRPSMIVSEFGAQAMPSWALMEEILQGRMGWPPSEDVLSTLSYHNYQHHETLNIAHIQQGKNMSGFWHNSQEYQRLVTKLAAENLRLRKGAGVAAIYQFMFVDSWPSITWSVLDVDRAPKPGYLALKESYQPLLAVAQADLLSERSLLTVTIINDSLSDYTGATLVVTNSYNHKSWAFSGLSVAANSTLQVVKQQSFDGLASYLTLEIKDNKGKTVSTNHYVAKDLEG